MHTPKTLCIIKSSESTLIETIIGVRFVDKTDEKILDMLKGNARMSYQELGNAFLDTLRANLEHCVGMAANMIGVKKNIIVIRLKQW